MARNLEQVNYQTHRDMRVKEAVLFEHAASSQFVPINANELGYASTCYPLFFTKDRKTAKLFPIALFGLDKNENLFFAKEGWRGSYIPKSMRLPAFSMVLSGDESKGYDWVVCVDANSSYLSKNEGSALYEGESESAYLANVRDALIDHHQGRLASLEFAERLIETKLLKPVTFELIYQDGEQKKFAGLYMIDEPKLKSLPENVILDFHHKGYFSPIYSMLNSQHKLFEMVRIKQAVEGRQIKALQRSDV